MRRKFNTFHLGLSTGPAVEVLVGGEESFTVHESLLRQGSPFFDKILSDNWKEATRQKIELPEELPGTFTIYVSWLYRSQIPTIPKRLGEPSEFLRLVQAYVFGDKIQARAFQNKIIDAIIEKNKDIGAVGLSSKGAIPSLTCVQVAYKNTLPGSPLRKLLVDFWVAAEEDKFDKETPRAFLEDLVKKLRLIAKKQLTRTSLIQPGLYYENVPSDKSST